MMVGVSRWASAHAGSNMHCIFALFLFDQAKKKTEKTLKV